MRGSLDLYMDTQKSYALITGASSGMGLEYARQLAAKGYNILVVSNREEDNIKVAESLKAEFGVDAQPFYADLSKSEASQAVFDWTV